ncbi:TorF family putative porin [Uliginosibacterium sp. H1]|uniref:TorF family putative porin n=1 Tax=Uliginosibacterium sp. H1 TaxID=3114757 RepID=UPI002E18FBBF|nr:TorF family putative porin [Uliginosibacterium sp. H1]
MRKTILASLIATTLSAPVLAQESPHSVTGNVSLASEYIYRGIGQTNRKPAIQGGFDYGHASGLYLGTWASNISWLNDANVGEGSSMEWDFYGGYKKAFGDWGVDVGLLQYYYPGNFDGVTSPNTLEAYGAVSWKMLTFKLSYAFTDLFGAKAPDGGDTDGSIYYELNGNFDVGAGFTLAAHLGRQEVSDFSDASYTDWKLGVTKELVGLTWGLYYVGSDAKGKPGEFYHNVYGKNLGDDRALLTVSKTF